MSVQVSNIKGTTAENAGYVGVIGQLVYDETKKTFRVMDGVTAGGFVLAREDLVALLDGSQQMTGALKLKKGANIASASTVNLANATGNEVHISGATGPITSFGTVAAGAVFHLIFDSTPTITYNATSMVLNTGGGSFTAAIGDRALAISEGGGNWNVTLFKADGSAINLLSNVQRSAIDGLGMTMPVAATTMPVGAGEATDSTNSIVLKLLAAISKTMANWAVGTGNGGKLSAAAIANNTTYHFFLIRRPDTGVVDVGFDVSLAPTMPANYTQYRRIFSWRTNGSAQWTPGLQDGDVFQLVAAPNDIGALPSSTATLRTLSVPTGIRVLAKLGVIIGNSGGPIGLSNHWDPALGATAPSAAAGAGRTFVNSAVSQGVNYTADVWTNTSGQIYNTGDASNMSSYTLQTLGWVDQRGRNS